MTRIENSIEIEASPEEIGEYLWDVNNLPKYLPISDVEIMETTENLLKVRHKFTAAGRTMDLLCDVKWLERNKKMLYNTTSGMRLEGTWLLEPMGKVTRLTNILAYQPPGWIFGRILDKLQIQKEMRRISREGLQQLKEVLETKR